MGVSASVLSKLKRVKNRPVDYSDKFRVPYQVFILIFIIFFILRMDSIMELFYNISIGEFSKFTLSQAVDRYEGDIKHGVLFKISTIMFFTYAMLLAWIDAKRKYLYYIIFIFLVFVESSALARAGVLMAFTSYGAAILIKYNKYFQSLSIKKYAGLLILAVLALSVVFLFSAYFRVAHHNDIASILLEKASVYIIAMYKSLVIWMHNSENYLTTNGLATFASLFKVFGVEVQQGFYTQTDTIYGGTNIYTSIRGLLSDFGYIGTSFIFIVFGFYINKCTYKYMSNIEYLFIYSIIIFCLFLLVSPYTFFTFSVSVIFSCLILFVFNNIRKSQS
jgi:oligosaccharide repeat unit polymerase